MCVGVRARAGAPREKIRRKAITELLSSGSGEKEKKILKNTHTHTRALYASTTNLTTNSSEFLLIFLSRHGRASSL